MLHIEIDKNTPFQKRYFFKIIFPPERILYKFAKIFPEGYSKLFFMTEPFGRLNLFYPPTVKRQLGLAKQVHRG